MTASQYRRAEPLGEFDQPEHRVRCPVHGFIRYSDNERHIIDHPLFQRLRFIRQLAVTEYVYPGATHTRFEHSLGVMEVASRMFDSLAAKKGATLKETLEGVPHYADHPLDRARQNLRLAALLHDIGHAPFSHAAEGLLLAGAGHEKLSVDVMRRTDLVGGLLDKLWGVGTAEAVASLYEGGQLMAPQVQVLHDIVAGETDADRTDYLLRDSHHCGVGYGRFDHLRLIDSLDLRDNGLGGLEIALQRDGVHAFEALILARYQMNTQVYYHRLRRIYDLYLQRYFDMLGEETKWDADRVLAENDITMTKRIMDDSVGTGPRSGIAQRIAQRRHHRMVHQTGDGSNAHDLRRAQEVFQEIERTFADADVILDKASASIHKLLVPDDQDDAKLVDLKLLFAPTGERSVGEESQVLRRIDRRFQCARIYADVPGGRSSRRSAIEERAAALWRERGGH